MQTILIWGWVTFVKKDCTTTTYKEELYMCYNVVVKNHNSGVFNSQTIRLKKYNYSRINN